MAEKRPGRPTTEALGAWAVPRARVPTRCVSLLLLGLATAPAAQEGVPRCPNFVVVFDSSESMSTSTLTADGGTKLPDGGSFTRYEAAKAAVKQVTQSHGEAVRFGLELFGLNGGGLGGCRVSSPTCFYPQAGCEAVLSDYRTYASIGSSLDLYAHPAGTTPTGAAIERALQRRDVQDLSRHRYLLLVTDGEPNEDCGNGATRAQSQAHALAALTAARVDAGVRTFVLSFPVPKQFEVNLDQMADAGGTARPGCQPDAGRHCYYSANSSAELDGALQEIISYFAGEVGRVYCDDTCYGQGCPVGEACRTLDLDAGPQCVTDPCATMQCGAGQVCLEGACQAVCTQACDAGDRCEDGSCVTPAPCNSECPGRNDVCVDGRCMEDYCTGKSALLGCPANAVCVQNSCFPLTSSSSSSTPQGSGSGCSAGGPGSEPWAGLLLALLAFRARGTPRRAIRRD